MEENKIIDVDYTEDSSENRINGRALYYSTSQVGIMIGETDSTIRFWCSKFKDIIKPEMSGSHRKFSEADIERLKYIKKLLREDGFSINQVVEYASEKDVKSIEKKIDRQEPLAMQALATAIAIEIGGQLEDYKSMIKNELIEEMKQGFKKQEDIQDNRVEELKDFIVVSVREGLQEEITALKAHVDNKELEARRRDEDMIDTLKKSMEEQKKLNEQKSKGFFGRLFNK